MSGIKIQVIRRLKWKIHFWYGGKECQANRFGVIWYKDTESKFNKYSPSGCYSIRFFDRGETEKLMVALGAKFLKCTKGGESLYCYKHEEAQSTVG